MSTKIRMIIRSFDAPFLDKFINTLPPNTKKVNLPESRVVYTVLRSPHIDKKSREQFEMRFKKKIIDIKADRHELRNKFFWLKRQRLIGAQCEFQFFYKTRLREEALSEIKKAACR